MTESRKARWGSEDLKTRGPAEQKIETTLKSPTKLEFVDTPLTDVIDYLKDYHQIEIQLDKKALEEASIDPAVTVTENLNGVSLKSALRLMLGKVGLTYVIQNEVLLITTTQAAESRLRTTVYPVADLVGQYRDENGTVWSDYESLMEMIKTTVQPNTWDEVGGTGLDRQVRNQFKSGRQPDAASARASRRPDGEAAPSEKGSRPTGGRPGRIAAATQTAIRRGPREWNGRNGWRIRRNGRQKVRLSQKRILR